MLSMGAMLLVAVKSEFAARLRGWYDATTPIFCMPRQLNRHGRPAEYLAASCHDVTSPSTLGCLATEVHVQCEGQCSVYVHDMTALCRPIVSFPLLSHACFSTVWQIPNVVNVLLVADIRRVAVVVCMSMHLWSAMC